MRALRWVAAAALLGGVAAVGRIALGRAGAARAPEEEGTEEAEPVLGYDGMDRDTLIEWLGAAELDPETLERVRRYETANRARTPVLEAIAELRR